MNNKQKSDGKSGGRIKDQILSSGGKKVKKKILIKKKPGATPSKNITDLYSQEQAAKKAEQAKKAAAGRQPFSSEARGGTPGQQAPGSKRPVPNRDRGSRPAPRSGDGAQNRMPATDAGAKPTDQQPGQRRQHTGRKSGDGQPFDPSSRKKSHEREKNNRFFTRADKRPKRQTESGTTVPSQIEIMESIQVGELAKKMNLKPGDIIARLMKMGEMVTINKVLDADTVTMLAADYKCEVKVVSLYEDTQVADEVDDEAARTFRPPVVTIMGHVDHGKTKLLDTIRKSDVAATEAGAITQHIGAYQVKTPRGKITFLDTPGHEAFTAMRARGAAITDIVVLVVAADDSVKEQTIEAISHAQQAKVPIIVAINKIDLPAADPDRVKKDLSQHGLLVEGWGGSSMVCEISAKQNIGIDNLLESILLQAEILELKANPSLRAVGCVVEARVDPGKGPVATVLVQKGTMREGDAYVIGIYSGRVRAMFSDHGNRVDAAEPAQPVEILGIDGVPEAGDPFQVVENEKFGREIASRRRHYHQITEAAERGSQMAPASDLTSFMERHSDDNQEMRVILKADVQGSVEAIKDGLLKLSFKDISCKVIHSATGAITESDLDLARVSNAMIIGFHVRPTPRIRDLAEQYRVEMGFYNVIYEIIETVRNRMEGQLEPEKVENVVGAAEIREIFKISKIGNVAGCMVTKGKVARKNQLRVIRDGKVIHTGDLKTLKRHKEDVNEVAENYECGIAVDGFNDIKIGDILESFEIQSVARKLTK